ncbi:UDP-N-acetylglucosamine 2-epimerase [Solibacillus silvestris StLB046]|uniref:UDP-N-acetylglucosamine 2-epimerase n=1 Tax=Solibacillus silvestris (strain StLB046) TaxID=1002809 RepID=F2F310_SOLSS|nr:UDP-N-acetylglucosamine 2-epimerase [Solibacillus silvestris]BAK17698.1 UDP-N-acetylglucosamine 2-epimerase [Solibacillus silvestris StLB046]
MKKIMFLTGTRADYGKIKSLMGKINENEEFVLYLFVTGMHMLSRYGSTWREIEKDGFKNVYHFINQNTNTSMDLALSNTITGLSHYVSEIRPDLIIVHGDRLEALAGAIVGAFNNIHVAHIEGGEVSGTIDESIRHAITKFAHTHFVSNRESKKRIEQLGEDSKNIFEIGSPDIDIMYSKNLPKLDEVKRHYGIPFETYSIVMYHPVTTEYNFLLENVKCFVDALIKSKRNYIVIYPNNDFGSELIIQEYERLKKNSYFIVYPSIRFEYFLTLMKDADFMIGNSSAGIRETTLYGVPSIDVGNRQKGRYVVKDKGLIQHVPENSNSILEAMKNIQYISRSKISKFGDGNSAERFLEIILDERFWEINIQKKFTDLE